MQIAVCTITYMLVLLTKGDKWNIRLTNKIRLVTLLRID